MSEKNKQENKQQEMLQELSDDELIGVGGGVNPLEQIKRVKTSAINEQFKKKI